MNKKNALIITIGFILTISSCVNQPVSTEVSSTPTETQTIPPTSTVTIEPTATPNQYLVDKNKLSKTPSSYDYLTTHLDEFVQGPDPWSVGAEAFIQWNIDKLTPALGDPLERDINLQVDAAPVGGGQYGFYCSPVSPITGQMEFFYFDHNGTIYPVYLITGYRPAYKDIVNIGVILVNEYWINETDRYFGFKTVDRLAEGDYKVIQVETYYGPNEHLSQDVNELIATGVSSVDRDNTYTYIGFGFIFIEK